jgi:hypothetical protein
MIRLCSKFSLASFHWQVFTGKFSLASFHWQVDTGGLPVILIFVRTSDQLSFAIIAFLPRGFECQTTLALL